MRSPATHKKSLGSGSRRAEAHLSNEQYDDRYTPEYNGTQPAA
jgi:hypothetical protein